MNAFVAGLASLVVIRTLAAIGLNRVSVASRDTLPGRDVWQ